MSQLFLTRFLAGDMALTVERIQEIQKEIPQDGLYVSKAIPDEEGVRPPTYTVGHFESDSHHMEDTIAEFWDGNHDGQAWARYFAAAPEIINFLLKELEKKSKKSTAGDKTVSFKLADGSSLTCKLSEILAVYLPSDYPKPGVYVTIYLKSCRNTFALEDKSAKMFFEEFPEWDVP